MRNKRKKEKNHENRLKKLERAVESDIEKVPRMPYALGFPQRIRMRMKYRAGYIIFTGASQAYSFNANSLYDPDNTSTGHQPEYYDQMSAFYKWYYVVSTIAKFEFVNEDSTKGATAGIIPSNYIITGRSAATMMEMDDSKYVQLAPKGSGKTSHTFKMKRFTSQMVGSKDVLGNTELRGLMGNFTVGSDPTTKWYFNAFGETENGMGALNLSITVTLIFDVILDGLLPPDLSLPPERMQPMVNTNEIIRREREKELALKEIIKSKESKK